MSTKNKSLTLKIRQLIPMNGALSRLSQATELPITTSFRIGRFISQTEGEFKRYDESRASVIKKWGEPVERSEEEIRQGVPESFRIDADKTESANAELNALLDEEVTIPSWKLLTATDFGKFALSPQEFATMLPLLSDNFLDEDEDDSVSEANTDMGDQKQIAAA